MGIGHSEQGQLLVGFLPISMFVYGSFRSGRGSFRIRFCIIVNGRSGGNEAEYREFCDQVAVVGQQLVDVPIQANGSVHFRFRSVAYSLIRYFSFFASISVVSVNFYFGTIILCNKRKSTWRRGFCFENTTMRI